jgi:glutamyl-tRNA synthetase
LVPTELERPYRGRFAPSPTGGLHLGLARTALLGYLRARAEGGRYVLRMEDLDTPRVVPGAAAEIMEELRFLGIEWDEGPDCGGAFGPYTQSERLARYEAAVTRLEQRGWVYPCTCSRKEIALASAPHGPAEFGPPYPGTCRHGPRREGPAALRFRVPEPLPAFQDAVRGERIEALAQGDFVVRRADGQYSYQLAVVVDDIEMQISEVLRGQDLAGCTGWQLALYDALGAPRPSFAHVPLLLDVDGRRLSKRDHATSVGALRAAGQSAAQIVGWLAASVGLVPAGAQVLPTELVADFSLARLSLG